MTLAVRDVPVPPRLEPFVRRVRLVAEAPDQSPYRRLPDGETELILRLSPGAATTGSWVGARTRPLHKPTATRTHFVLVRFHVAGAAPFVSAPVATLTDHVVPLEELWPRERCATLEAAADPEGATQLILDALVARSDAYRPDAWRRARDAVQAIRTARHLPSSGQLADAVGSSERQLRRIFADVIGMSPKRYLRTVRFQRALALARSSAAPNWAAIAQRADYFDQAHLISEFRQLAGQSPARYLRALAAQAR